MLEAAGPQAFCARIFLSSRSRSIARNYPAQSAQAAIIALLESAGARDKAGSNAAALFEAVLQKDQVRVEEALRLGVNPNAKDDRGVPPLVLAARLGHPGIVEALVRAGADVSANPEHGTTPLISAISGGNVETVKALLAALDHAGRYPELQEELRRAGAR